MRSAAPCACSNKTHHWRDRFPLQFSILRITMPSDESPGPFVTNTTAQISDAERYSRQVLFAGIGTTGQQRLAEAHVAIIGCGAMGAASASLLARAGVSAITIIDRDFVEPSNLQRQVLFDEDD